MCIALPIGYNDESGGTTLLGTGFLAGKTPDGRVAVVTALHILGNSKGSPLVILPQHGGDCKLVQGYPVTEIRFFKTLYSVPDEASDLCVVVIHAPAATFPAVFIQDLGDVQVGEEMVVLGYPFSPMGSVLETWHTCTVTALGRRMIFGPIMRDELVLSLTAHPGQSGSPVVRKRDGLICGVLRGCLAPPGVQAFNIGGIQPWTDTTVTFATGGHLVPALVRHALR